MMTKGKLDYFVAIQIEYLRNRGMFNNFSLKIVMQWGK